MNTQDTEFRAIVPQYRLEDSEASRLGLKQLIMKMLVLPALPKPRRVGDRRVTISLSGCSLREGEEIVGRFVDVCEFTDGDECQRVREMCVTSSRDVVAIALVAANNQMFN